MAEADGGEFCDVEQVRLSDVRTAAGMRPRRSRKRVRTCCRAAPASHSKRLTSHPAARPSPGRPQNPLISSAYVRPRRVEYVQAGVSKTWDTVEAFSSVAVLIHHRVRDTFVLVRQFRPAIWATEQNEAARGLGAGNASNGAGGSGGGSPQLVHPQQGL
jgi:hypothetical protein